MMTAPTTPTEALPLAILGRREPLEPEQQVGSYSTLAQKWEFPAGTPLARLRTYSRSATTGFFSDDPDEDQDDWTDD